MACINPIRHRLMMHLQQAPNAPQARAFEIQAQGLFACLLSIAMGLRFEGGMALTAFALIALTAARIASGFDQGITLTMQATVHATNFISSI